MSRTASSVFEDYEKMLKSDFHVKHDETKEVSPQHFMFAAGIETRNEDDTRSQKRHFLGKTNSSIFAEPEYEDSFSIHYREKNASNVFAEPEHGDSHSSRFSGNTASHIFGESGDSCSNDLCMEESLDFKKQKSPFNNSTIIARPEPEDSCNNQYTEEIARNVFAEPEYGDSHSSRFSGNTASHIFGESGDSCSNDLCKEESFDFKKQKSLMNDNS